ncbi:hypothetical protein MP228_011923 [Amoeboaphelidium protococcarum]|nr:hypothetical protein MP228_011923 [Amoeboaphelidium protococcarum]
MFADDSDVEDGQPQLNQKVPAGKQVPSGDKKRVHDGDSEHTIAGQSQQSALKKQRSTVNQQQQQQAANNAHQSKEAAVVGDYFETEAESQFQQAKVDAETGKIMSSKEQQETIKLQHAIRHDVAIPPGYAYVPMNQHIPWDPPAKSYPFTLDPFQQTAIASIERNESVLVAAHTSAGKTVVAEYAISAALKQKQRVIYTSPIKALSNQKYREMAEEFGDVGLMTGDVTINPSASLLVMTTEILRSMMYRGSEVMREVAWVIFDEIHYMRDKERGVVWEESIILLPHKVRYVFLSATIPNAKQFAEWICKTHNQPCHVVYTNFRPVPLQHYVFPQGGDGIHLCVDEKGTFKEENFAKAIANVQTTVTDGKANAARGRKGGKKDLSRDSDLFKLMKMIWLRNYQPVIVFSFSKRECEGYAMQLSKLDFNNDTEKELVSEIYKNAMAGLSEDDQQLPQILHLLPLLQRGIGIHHSGLLQILKEVIEILFQEGLIKVLFATETFSIGLNMPAKTVVFTSVEKFDGAQTRPLGSGEYIQMSGRAGRRGLDDRGIVIMMVGKKLEPDVAKTMLKGEPDVLNSAYHLTYSMILNLMRIEGLSPQYMLERSFYQYQHSDNVPHLLEQVQSLRSEMESLQIDSEDVVKEYCDASQKVLQLYDQFRAVITHPDYCLPFIKPGRLVEVKKSIDNGQQLLNYGWCTVVNCNKKTVKRKGRDDEIVYLVDILAKCDVSNPQKVSSDGDYPPAAVAVTDSYSSSSSNRTEVMLMVINLRDICNISSVKIHLPKDLNSSLSRGQVGATVDEVCRRFDGSVPLLDPVKDMNIKDDTFNQLLNDIKMHGEIVANNAYGIAGERDPQLHQDYQNYLHKMDLKKKHDALQKTLDDTQSILQLDELRHRIDILRRLEYLDERDLVSLKGRIACEITTGDELVIGELLFNGAFNDLSIPQIVALLSCIVTQERSNNEVVLRSEMVDCVRLLKDTARKVAQLSVECLLQIDPEQYVNDFRTDMVNALYAWADGAKFSEICKMTDIFEGSVIRIIRRLEELLRQMVAASKQIGNQHLEEKFTECGDKIRRDIVFAASLYL